MPSARKPVSIRSTQAHGDDTAGGQNAVGGCLEIDDEENEGNQDQQDAGEVDGQVGECQERQDSGDHAHHPGQEEAGMGDPERHADHGQPKQQVGDVRVRGRLEHLVEIREVEALDGGVGGVQRVGLAEFDHLPSVKIAQQCLNVAALKVNDSQPRRQCSVGKAVKARRLGGGVGEYRRGLGEALLELTQDPSVLIPHRGGVGLLEDRAHKGGDHGLTPPPHCTAS